MELNVQWKGVPISICSEKGKSLGWHQFVQLLKTAEMWLPKGGSFILHMDCAAVTPKKTILKEQKAIG